jgi:drug/metabolite transporter (DMT)-like permease
VTVTTETGAPLPADAPGQRRDSRAVRLGIAYGCGMAIGAASAFVAARAGIVGGLGPADLTLARFLGAGLVLLPTFIRFGPASAGGVGWRRAAVLTLLAGPLFAMLQMGGYVFAPLAHGAVIAPSTVTILSTFIAVMALGERLTGAHMAGASLVIVGIVVLGWESIIATTDSPRAWIGDLLFMFSSFLWAGFTVMIRYWMLPAGRAAAAVSVIALVITLAAYAAWFGTGRLASLPLLPFAQQVVIQGLLSGAAMTFAFSRAIALLGVSRAVLFPAIVPALAVLLGIPLLGEWPTVIQIAGLCLVSAGLMTAIGITGQMVRVVRR